jgi:tRNA(fMet)-specific endonuclease VapC
MFLLDTNACVHLLRDTSPRLRQNVRRRQPSEIGLCSVVKAELIYGARRSARVGPNLDILHRFFSAFTSLPFDDESAEHYGLIRTDLERAGTLIGPNDLMIAAIARSRDLVLVTHNTGEFSRVEGLRLEDWELGD